jgi:Ni/Co efflux regulator RcnB
MEGIRGYISSILLAAAIAAPMAVVATAAPQDRDDRDHDRSRVYDRDHKDYHHWDDREDHAYRSYLTEKHKTYREYNKQNARMQRDYWKWRHEHPDHD